MVFVAYGFFLQQKNNINIIPFDEILKLWDRCLFDELVIDEDFPEILFVVIV